MRLWTNWIGYGAIPVERIYNCFERGKRRIAINGGNFAPSRCGKLGNLWDIIICDIQIVLIDMQSRKTLL